MKLKILLKMLLKILNKIGHREVITPEEFISFVEKVVEQYGKHIDSNLILLGLRSGLSNEMINACISIINSNKDIFKIQEYILYSKDGRILLKLYEKL